LHAVAGIAQIAARLEQRLGPLAGEPLPLEGGITNRNFRVRFGATDYVVRLPGRDTELLGISREAERAAGEAAARLGIGPEVVAGERDCLVTRYLGARPVDVTEALAELGRALRAFHGCGVSLPVRFWVPDVLDRYASLVRERGGELPGEYGEAQELARRIAAVLPLTEPVPCHNDLLPGNLLQVDERVVLVDWEYAGMGHRLFDLGNLAVNNELDERAEHALLGAYCGGPPGAGVAAALRLMRVMSDAREAAWGVLQAVISELEFDFHAYAREHFERLLQTAAQPIFDDWLSDAAAA
jgi:thiamine kinase-like enzyme